MQSCELLAGFAPASGREILFEVKEQEIGWDRGRLARNEREARKRFTTPALSNWKRLPYLAGETPAVPANLLLVSSKTDAYQKPYD